MITLNSLSGGKTSSYMAVHYPADLDMFSLVCIDDKRCKPKDPGIIQRVNDKLDKHGYIDRFGPFIATAEDDKILKVMFDLEQMIGREIIWVRGESFDKVNAYRKSHPSRNRRYCTSEMKIVAMAEAVYRFVGEKVLNNVGFRMDEQERAKYRTMVTKIKVGKLPDGRNKWLEFEWADEAYPMIKDLVVYPQIIEFWNNNNIDFPQYSNCIGCFWRNTQNLRKLWDLQPEKMEWFAQEEDKYSNTYKEGISFRQIKRVAPQLDFNFGGGAGCSAGFCTD